jgi:hypothetical protein
MTALTTLQFGTQAIVVMLDYEQNKSVKLKFFCKLDDYDVALEATSNAITSSPSPYVFVDESSMFPELLTELVVRHPRLKVYGGKCHHAQQTRALESIARSLEVIAND